LKVITTLIEDHKINVSIQIDQSEVENAIKIVAQEINKRYKFPGFRPGKAPLDFIKATIGENELRKEAIEMLAEEKLEEALKQIPYKITSKAKLKNINMEDPENISFSYEIPLAVEVNLGDYYSINIPHEPPVITEEDVNKQLHELQLSEMVLEPVERPSQEGDHLTVRIEGVEVNHTDEGKTLLINETNVPIVIKAEDDISPFEYPFPGFSRYLIGLKASEEKVFQYQYPDDSIIEMFRGKIIEFKVIVDKVSETILPPLDDEFASSIKENATLDELKSNIWSELREKVASDFEKEYRTKIEDKLLDICSVNISSEIIEDEFNRNLSQIQRYWENRGLPFDTLLKINNKSHKEFVDELKVEVERKLKLDYILEEIARKENINVNEEDIKRQANEEMNKYLSSMPKKEVKKINTKLLFSSIVENIKKDGLADAVWKRLEEIASKQTDETKV